MTSQPAILVTGGGGFLGTAIVRMLCHQGRRVRSLSRKRYPQLTQMGVEQFQGDLADADAVREACKGVEVVYHVAARPGVWGSFESFYGPNVVGTENIIDSCFRCKVRRLIYTSSPSVVFDGRDMEGVDESVPYAGRFHSHYPHTKALAEQKVLAATKNGLPAIALRPHLIWGPGDNHLVPRILARAHRLRRVGNGRNKVDTIYVDNAAQAHLLADLQLKANPGLSGNVYFISQDKPVALWDMVDRLLEAGGKAPVQKTISPRLAWFAGALCESLFKLLGLKSEPPMTRFMAQELATAHWFNISAAKSDLGYVPAVSTEEGLQRLAHWLQKQNG